MKASDQELGHLRQWSLVVVRQVADEDLYKTAEPNSVFGGRIQVLGGALARYTHVLCIGYRIRNENLPQLKK